MDAIKNDAKKVFMKKGTCSQTFCYLLNREFGHLRKNEEQATDLLAGGILQQGCQCGMLWGASLAAGAESFRRCGDRGRATALAIKATRHILESFVNRTKSADCRDITHCDWSSKWSIAKYMFSGRFWSCFKLAGKWAPEAIRAASEGLSIDPTALPAPALSCASEVVGKMGATAAEMVMVAGFAGGLGLSGHGCGALGAALWMNALARIREKNYKNSFSDPIAKKILKAFQDATDSEILCSKITGRSFKTIEEHTEFVKNGGCEKLIAMLARS
jgi:hypothetical protein